jgi:hypothetical protein
MRIENSYDHPLGVLPPALTHLTMGRAFNRPLGALPPALQVLHLGHSYNHPLSALPPALEHLTLPRNYRHGPPAGPVPRTLRYLTAPFNGERSLWLEGLPASVWVTRDVVSLV